MGEACVTRPKSWQVRRGWWWFAMCMCAELAQKAHSSPSPQSCHTTARIARNNHAQSTAGPPPGALPNALSVSWPRDALEVVSDSELTMVPDRAIIDRLMNLTGCDAWQRVRAYLSHSADCFSTTRSIEGVPPRRWHSDWHSTTCSTIDRHSRCSCRASLGLAARDPRRRQRGCRAR